ncbi:MAG: NAD(P)H-binding protein [Halobacteriota archaeon]
MNVLVMGASGFVGSALLPALVDAGHDVRALVRDASRFEPPDGVTIVEGDLLQPASLDGVFDGIEVAYYLVHSLRTGPDFAARDRRTARTVATRAADAGVERVIYLGGLGEVGADLSEHLASRREVESILATGQYALTVLRAAIIIGAGSASFTVIRDLAGRLPVMITPRWVRTECQPIAIDDVVTYLIELLRHPETAGQTYEIGGPDIVTYEQLIRMMARHLGRRLVIIPVPVLTVGLSVYWIDLVTRVPKSIAHPLVHGLQNPVVVTDHRIREIIPIELTPLDEAIEAALERPTDSRNS